jgi:hypothetical protein
MINLTTNIPIANDIPRITKWQVADAHDCANQTPPCLSIAINLIGPGAVIFGSYNLAVFDAIASSGLAVNPSPTGINDQFSYTSAVLPGNQYTALAAIWNGNCTGGGTRAKRLAALEAALVTAGVLSAAFAGT